MKREVIHSSLEVKGHLEQPLHPDLLATPVSITLAMLSAGECAPAREAGRVGSRKRESEELS